MTRKHFEGIAEVLKQVFLHEEDEYQKALKEDLCYAMASKLAEFNDNFNHKKFIRACGID